MSKAAQRGALTRDNELIVISRGFDLIATLAPDRRRFVVEYWLSRLEALPVIAQVEDPVEDDEPPMIPRLRGAAS
jgi:hypothetical protein